MDTGLNAVLVIFALCCLHCMTNDDGRCKKNGANEDAGDHDGDEQSFETDDPRHDEATHCKGEEKITNAVG